MDTQCTTGLSQIWLYQSTQHVKKVYAENLADCFRTERFKTNLGREVFCAPNFELPHYRLHTDFSKKAYAENLVNIASERRVLQPN